MNDSSLASAAVLLSEQLGLNPDAFGKGAIEEALALQMAAGAVNDPELFVKTIASDPAKKIAMIERLIPAETWFFRDQTPFELLRQIANSFAEKKPGATIRVLSAPCSTGEEPYSIAIAMLQAGLAPKQFNILAVDISPAAIDQARKALYKPASFRGVTSEECKSQFFLPDGENFCLKPEIAGLVAFQRADICNPGFLSKEQPFDIIFCRNFLIYLRLETQMALLATLKRLMKPDAALFAGHPEAVFFSRNGFEPVQHPRFFAMRLRAVKNQPASPPQTQPISRPEKIEHPPLPATPLDIAPDLETAGPCRRCRERATSGRALFDREMPPGLEEETTELLARKKETAPMETLAALAFNLGNELFALRLNCCEEVTMPSSVHSIPSRSSPAFPGLANVNGELMPCLAPARIMGIPQAADATPEQRRFINVRFGSERFVLIADAIRGVIRTVPEELKPMPNTIARTQGDCVVGIFTVNGNNIALIDEAKLLKILNQNIA